MSDATPHRASGRRRPSLRMLVAVVGTVIALGAVAGAVWGTVTPAMTARAVDATSATIDAQQFPEEFAGVAVFVLLLAGYGVVSTVIGWVMSRRWRGPAGALAVIGSSFLGALLAATVGTWIARARFGDAGSVPNGSSFSIVPHLWLSGAVADGTGGRWIVFVFAPLTAALAYLVLALSARAADLGAGDLAGPELARREPGGGHPA